MSHRIQSPAWDDATRSPSRDDATRSPSRDDVTQSPSRGDAAQSPSWDHATQSPSRGDATRPLDVDIFCRVVDNFGDIGVCWRLARRFAHDLGWTVRLWVDDLASFKVLAPALCPAREVQSIDGITIRQWDALGQVRPAQVVIEAFACDPPVGFVAAMRAMSPTPVWINLEYLSAEEWVEGYHGVASMRPDGLRKYFFFPGFTADTGGLLREPGLLARRDQVQRNTASRQATLRELALYPLAECLDAPGARLVSLFCYPHAPLAAVLDALGTTSDGAPTVICVPPHVAPGLDTAALPPGVEIERMPFLGHTDYDRLLWCMDLNVVRGEDSFVRAIWAGRPMLWHIYPQQDDAHLVKLDAWLALAGLPEHVRMAQQAFNQGPGAGGTAPAAGGTGLFAPLAQVLTQCLSVPVWDDWASAARAHSDGLATMWDLADNLAKFCVSALHSR